MYLKILLLNTSKILFGKNDLNGFFNVYLHGNLTQGHDKLTSYFF